MKSNNELAVRSGKGRASFPEALVLAERKELMSESFSQYPFPDGEVSAPEAAVTLSPSDRLTARLSVKTSRLRSDRFWPKMHFGW
jgi:hypothetical protein